MKRSLYLSLALSLLSQSAWTREVRPKIPNHQVDPSTGLIFGVDIRDQSHNRIAAHLEQTLVWHPNTFFHSGVRFQRQINVAKCLQTDSICANEVYAAVPERIEKSQRPGELNLILNALYSRSSQEGLLLRKYRMVLSVQDQMKPVRMKRLSERHLDRSHFEMQVSIRDLTLSIAQPQFGFRLILPIAAGGVNALRSEETSWMTPEIRSAEVGKTDAVSFKKRCEPDYFKCLPFVPIRVRGAAQRTDLGFHIYPGREFQRGYLSHGCLRLRERDLFLVYALATKSGSHATPLSLEHNPSSSEMHPHPVFVRHVMAVKNCGERQSCKDEHGLTRLVARPMATVRSLFQAPAPEVADLGVEMPSFN